jgi:microcystin-dependent protein
MFAACLLAVVCAVAVRADVPARVALDSRRNVITYSAAIEAPNLPANASAEMAMLRELLARTAELLANTTAELNAYKAKSSELFANTSSVIANLQQRLSRLEATSTSPVPIGGIIMWSGSVSSIPQGWVLCNGAPNPLGATPPDLRNRFIVGAGSNYTVGATGGADSVVLTGSQMPADTHRVGITYWSGQYSFFNGELVRATKPALTLATQHIGYVLSSPENSGGTAPFDNRPSFYALAYIMRVS